MECPHCATDFAESWTEVASPGDARVVYHVEWTTCPSCSRGVLKAWFQDRGKKASRMGERLLVPAAPSRPPRSEVPEPYASLFAEAARTLVDSPRASAALSRRCLRQLLVAEAGAPADGSLAAQLEWAINESEIPPANRLALHRIRSAGRVVMLAPKSEQPESVVDATPLEAEANLAGLERLFDHFFPVRRAAPEAS